MKRFQNLKKKKRMGRSPKEEKYRYHRENQMRKIEKHKAG